MSKDRFFETILPRRVKPQPQPHIVAGGDCGACVLAGIFDEPVEWAYDKLKGKRESFGHDEMSRSLRVSLSSGFSDRIIDDAAQWDSWSAGFIGQPAYLVASQWFNYVQMAIDAGYYGLAEIDFAKNAGEAKGGPDHWVMICGAQSGIKWEGSSGTFIMNVLVSCSATSSNMQTEWVRAWDFLRYRGGYNLLFARPLS